MAKKCGVADSVISRYSRKAGIITKQMRHMKEHRNGKFKNKGWLEKQLSEKSIRQIARECNASHTNIAKWKKKYGL